MKKNTKQTKVNKSSFGSLLKYGITPDIGPYNPFAPGEPLGWLPEPSTESFNLGDFVGVTVHRRTAADIDEEPRPGYVGPEQVPSTTPDEDTRRKPKPVFPWPGPTDDDDGPRGPFAIAVQDFVTPEDTIAISDFIFATIDPEEPRSIPDECPYNPKECEMEPFQCEETEEFLHQIGLELSLCPSSVAALEIRGHA